MLSPKSKSSQTGNAPCICGWYIPIIYLTGYNESDGGKQSGKNWECCLGQFCPNCGEPLCWMHQPSLDSLVFPKKLTKVYAV